MFKVLWRIRKYYKNHNIYCHYLGVTDFIKKSVNYTIQKDNPKLEFNNFNIEKRNTRFTNYKKLYLKSINKQSLNEDLINFFLSILENTNGGFIKKTLRMTVFEI